MRGLNNTSAILRRVLVLLPLFIGLGFFFVRVCAEGGAMGSAYQTCDCRGVEWQLFDRIAVDGPRRSLCIGMVRSRTCFQSREGPVVPCD